MAAKALDKTVDDIIGFDKIAEGGSYRVFQANLRDGREVIARLPYPCTTPRGHGILGEVATMAFLRTRGLPIPKVYSWSSTPKNPIGSEYIIMEKAQGSPLQKTWYSMTVGERLQMVEKVVLLEKKLFEIPLPACGAIYFKDSLPAGTPVVAIPECADDKGSSKFCIGPSMEHLWWYSKRDKLGADMGPCE